MKLGWEVKNLIDVCEKMFAGGDVPKDNFSKIETAKYKIPIFANGIKDKGLYGFTDIEKVINPSITISARGTIGYSEIRNEPFFPIVRLIVLIPNTKIITLEFLQYIIKSIDFKKSGTSIPQLTIPNVKKYQLNIPLIDEQKQIVNILDKAFESIEKAKLNIEKNLKNSKEFFQSKLNEIFSQKGDGWEEKRLKDVCILQRGFDLPKRLRTDGKFVLVSSGGISDTHNEYKVKAPGVVTGRSGTIGKVHYIKEDYWPLNTVLYIKEFYKNNEKFIYYLLKHFDLQKYASGAGVPTLNRNFVHDELVNIPISIKEQNDIVKSLDILIVNLDDLEKKYQQKLNNLEELKKSILQKAFNGELT